jgi:hypothetical protein
VFLSSDWRHAVHSHLAADAGVANWLAMFVIAEYVSPFHGSFAERADLFVF